MAVHYHHPGRGVVAALLIGDDFPGDIRATTAAAHQYRASPCRVQLLGSQWMSHDHYFCGRLIAGSFLFQFSGRRRLLLLIVVVVSYF